MDQWVSNNPQQVVQILDTALDRIIENRQADKAFTDQEDVKAKSYFSTLEGLDALLIPLVILPKARFWQQINDKHSIISLLVEDIEYVLRANPLSDRPPEEQGMPYFVRPKGGRFSGYWTSECTSFTLSVLTNFLSLRNEVSLSEGPEDEEVLDVIRKNLDWIEGCRKEKRGWSWTEDPKDAVAHPWPTWSLIDTFEEMLHCRFVGKEIHARVKANCNDIIEEILHQFTHQADGSYLDSWRKNVDRKGSNYDVQTALDLTRLMLAVTLHRSPGTIIPLAEMLFDWAGGCEWGDWKDLDDWKNDDIEYEYELIVGQRRHRINDSSLMPSVLRALVTMLDTLSTRGRKDVKDSIRQEPKNVINRTYNAVMLSLINEGKYRGLWGVPEKKTVDGNRVTVLTYELYYTERVIEALVDFLDPYCDRTEVFKTVQEDKRLDHSTQKESADPSAAKGGGGAGYSITIGAVYGDLTIEGNKISFGDRQYNLDRKPDILTAIGAVVVRADLDEKWEIALGGISQALDQLKDVKENDISNAVARALEEAPQKEGWRDRIKAFGEKVASSAFSSLLVQGIVQGIKLYFTSGQVSPV